jgi:hypothetical protein
MTEAETTCYINIIQNRETQTGATPQSYDKGLPRGHWQTTTAAQYTHILNRNQILKQAKLEKLQ